jgi:hypothetical protein
MRWVILVSEVETRLAEIEAAVARAIGERPICQHPHGMFGSDFCARCDAAAAMPVIRDQLARVRTDTIEQCAEAVEEGIAAAEADNAEAFVLVLRAASAAVRGVSHEH